eukprot:jgi/Tetstr1/443502/TSEL_031506.t1
MIPGAYLKSTLLEFKTMRYGVKYTAVPRATAVDRFERSLLGDIHRGLAARDAAWHNTEPGQKGPLRDNLDMSEYTGMVFGTMAHQAACGTCPRQRPRISRRSPTRSHSLGGRSDTSARPRPTETLLVSAAHRGVSMSGVALLCPCARGCAAGNLLMKAGAAPPRSATRLVARPARWALRPGGHRCRVTPRNESDADEEPAAPAPASASGSADWGDSARAENWDYDNRRDWKGIAMLVALGLTCAWGARLLFGAILGALPAKEPAPSRAPSAATAATAEPAAAKAEAEEERGVALEPEDLFGRSSQWPEEADGGPGSAAAAAGGAGALRLQAEAEGRLGRGQNGWEPSAFQEDSGWLQDDGLDAGEWTPAEASDYEAQGEVAADAGGEGGAEEAAAGEAATAPATEAAAAAKADGDADDDAEAGAAVVDVEWEVVDGREAERSGEEAGPEAEDKAADGAAAVEASSAASNAEEKDEEEVREGGKGQPEMKAAGGAGAAASAEPAPPPPSEPREYEYETELPIEALPASVSGGMVSAVELPATAVDPLTVDELPKDKTLRSFSKRSSVALSAATAASEASNRASAYAAAASAAASKAAESATAASVAARFAHQGMESATEEAMEAAEARVAAAAKSAQEAEGRAAASAGMASAYEDVASNQKDLAQRAARLDPEPEPEPTRAESWLRAKLAWWEMSPLWQKTVAALEPARDAVVAVAAKLWSALVAVAAAIKAAIWRG